MGEELVTSLDMPETSQEGVNDISKVITAIDQILSNDNFKQKSLIEGFNTVGILNGLAINKYLEETLGFRNQIVDMIIIEKMQYILSVKGKGGERIIKGISSLQPEINTIMQTPTGLEKFSGVSTK